MSALFHSKQTPEKNTRRRGRPAGQNRVPLSLEERRALNAQYERERRNETAKAMAELAEAAGCHSQITNSDLLATVISRFQRVGKRKSPENSHSVENMKKINDQLESQIASLQKRLESDSNLRDDAWCITTEVSPPAQPEPGWRVEVQPEESFVDPFMRVEEQSYFSKFLDRHDADEARLLYPLDDYNYLTGPQDYKQQ